MRSEQVNYGPDTIYKVIADVLSETKRSGTFLRELKMGDLVPLQKPGKKEGPVCHLTPIIKKSA